jgi:hypothetical protein
MAVGWCADLRISCPVTGVSLVSLVSLASLISLVSLVQFTMPKGRQAQITVAEELC